MNKVTAEENKELMNSIKPIGMDHYLKEMKFNAPDINQIVINDLKKLLHGKANITMHTINFLYDWASFGVDNYRYDLNHILDEVCINKCNHGELWRAEIKYPEDKYASFTCDKCVAEQFLKNKGDDAFLIKKECSHENFRCYPLCEAIHNILGPDCIAVDELKEKANTEKEYIVCTESL